MLLLGILAGVGNLVAIPFVNPDQFMLASDVYLVAADTFLEGGQFYDVTPQGRPGYSYLYPPITVLAFLPNALLGSSTASFAIQTLANLAFGGGLAAVCWRALARRGVSITAIDRALLGAFVVLSAHSAITLVNGQITIPLALAVAVGFDALDRGRERLAGVAFASAALFKVFPAVLGIWLVRNRAWKGLLAAIVTGLGGLALGALLLGPDLTLRYLEGVLLERYRTESFDGRPTPTTTIDGAQRQLAAIFGVGGVVLTLLALVLVGSLVSLLYRKVDTPERWLAAMLGTTVAVLLVFPLRPLYYPFLAYPLILALYLFPAGRARQVLVTGTVISFVRIEYTVLAASLQSLPVPDTLEATALSAFETAFIFILPPTIGLWLLLIACVVLTTYEGRRAGHRRSKRRCR